MTFTRKTKSEKTKSDRVQTCASHATFLVTITSLTFLVFVIGCPPAEPGPPGPPGFDPGEVEPNPVEPKTEPNQVEPTTEPNQLEPETEPNQLEPTTEPNQVEPTTEPNQVEPRVEANDTKPSPKVRFHSKCAAILTNFVNDKGMVDYKTLRRKRLELKVLLNEFAKLKKNEYNRWPKNDKIAFWINAYNIQMLRIIVENYPIKASRWHRLLWPPTSIRHIPPQGAVGAAKWNKYKIMVMDEQFTLAEIEQRFFREEFDEPRLFFAISLASLSSPPLRNEPYCGHRLDKQLNDQARRFLSSRRAFRIDREKETVHLFALLQPTWYGKEFISKYRTDKKFKDHKTATRAVLNFITNYVSSRDKLFLENQYYDVKYIKYDWRLNDSSAKR